LISRNRIDAMKRQMRVEILYPKFDPCKWKGWGGGAEEIQNTCSFDHSVTGALCQKCDDFFSAENEVLRS
jgi:hypothetical protein